MKVWLATSGEYSDFGVLAAYATEAAARHAVEVGWADDVTEYDLHDDHWTPQRIELWTVRASVARRAEHDRSLEISSLVHWDLPDEISSGDYWRQVHELDKLTESFVKVRNHAHQDRTELAYHSLDRERAVKVVSDKVAKLKAERDQL